MDISMIDRSTLFFQCFYGALGAAPNRLPRLALQGHAMGGAGFTGNRDGFGTFDEHLEIRIIHRDRIFHRTGKPQMRCGTADKTEKQNPKPAHGICIVNTG